MSIWGMAVSHMTTHITRVLIWGRTFNICDWLFSIIRYQSTIQRMALEARCSKSARSDFQSFSSHWSTSRKPDFQKNSAAFFVAHIQTFTKSFVPYVQSSRENMASNILKWHLNPFREKKKGLEDPNLRHFGQILAQPLASSNPSCCICILYISTMSSLIPLNYTAQSLPISHHKNVFPHLSFLYLLSLLFHSLVKLNWIHPCSQSSWGLVWYKGNNIKPHG